MSLAQNSYDVPFDWQDASPSEDRRPTRATMLMWVDRDRHLSTPHGLVGLAPPALVLNHPPTGREVGRIDLAELGYAHRITAVAFLPSVGCTSITLREALDTSPSARVAEYQISKPGFLDLYSVGWAVRAAEVVFNS